MPMPRAPFTDDELQAAESYIAAGEAERVLPALTELVATMEAYIDEYCETTNEVQYFSFATPFEKLTYQRVEDDPRRLEIVPAPFDRAYADLAYCYMAREDFESAIEPLKQAVRWNPMYCAYRLDLASVMTRCGLPDEAVRLSYSVLARASRSVDLVRAYLNLHDYYRAMDQYETACACVHSALALAPNDARAKTAAERLATEHGRDAFTQSPEVAEKLLDAEGIPEGANVEVVLSALLLADIATHSGDTQTAADMNLIAIDLVGQQNAQALAQMVHEG